MVAAAIRKSEEIGVLETVCVVDDGGFPLALERMDGARITGPQIAWNKALRIYSIVCRTVRHFRAMRLLASSGVLRANSQSSLEDSRSWWMTK